MPQAQKDKVRKRFFTASVSDARKPRTETTTNGSRNSSFSIEARETGTNCDLRVVRSLHLNFIFLFYLPIYFQGFFLKIVSRSISNIMFKELH